MSFLQQQQVASSGLNFTLKNRNTSMTVNKVDLPLVPSCKQNKEEFVESTVYAQKHKWEGCQFLINILVLLNLKKKHLGLNLNRDLTH